MECHIFPSLELCFISAFFICTFVSQNIFREMINGEINPVPTARMTWPPHLATSPVQPFQTITRFIILNLIYRFHSIAGSNLLINFIQLVWKHLPVLGSHDRFNRCSKDLHSIFLQNATLKQLHSCTQNELEQLAFKNVRKSFLLNNWFFSYDVEVKAGHHVTYRVI